MSGLNGFIIGVRHWLGRNLRRMRLIWWGKKLKLFPLRLNHLLLCRLQRIKVLRRKIISGRVRKVPLLRLLEARFGRALEYSTSNFDYKELENVIEPYLQHLIAMVFEVSLHKVR